VFCRSVFLAFLIVSIAEAKQWDGYDSIEEYFAAKAPSLKGGYMYPISDNVAMFQARMDEISKLYEQGQGYCRFQTNVSKSGIVTVTGVTHENRRKECQTPFKYLISTQQMQLPDPPSMLKNVLVTLPEEKL